MSLIKWNNVMDRPVSNLFKNFFDSDVSDFLSDWKGTHPSVNVLETQDDYRVEVAVPGMAKEDFDIKLDNDLLVISGKNEESKEDKKENFIRREFSYSSFQRSFHLPAQTVDSEKIEANYKDGILLVTIPKKEEAKKENSPKQISIT